ncbi:N-6 DNA methylase [Vibrio parahaemolyticus]|uniref:N-6 DNA methylase n=2 Tax=Vibrio parahaemolyticus TaxID=670 RepID=UPI0003FCAB9C|nr:N-6 DNA methylase [Vibrio parahaemolyticus]EHZ2589752.1 N-6 DNA methylase [Vibrio parahaemolyticus]EJT0908905.1 N-6 DNA methylase [Vibrio parahaemolyticus]
MNVTHKLFNQLFSLLKRERKIKNTAQVVEFISIFLYLKYLQIDIGEEREPLVYTNDKDFLEKCHRIIRYSRTESNTLHNSSFVEELMINSIDSCILNIDNKSLLYCLSEFFSSISHVYDLKELNSPYNELIEKMVLESSQSGEFYTPKPIAEVIVNYLKPESAHDIYDPACGTSGFLLEISKYIERNVRSNSETTTLFGSDISFFAFIVSKVNLILNSELESCISLGDSLETVNGVYSTDRTYDIVLTNPPFGKSNNKLDGSQSEQYIDYNFLRLTMYSVGKNGRAAIMLPERFLYDSSPQAKFLKHDLFNSFNVDCILSLPSGALLPYTGVKLVVIFFSASTPSGKTWLYKLDKKEKLTKNKKLETIDFIDFLNKSKHKEESNNSWVIDVSEIKPDYNLLDKAERKANYKDFTVFSKSVDDFTKVGSEIYEAINAIDHRVKLIQNKISKTNSEYNFSKVKIGDLVASCKTAPLSKELLLPEGSYPVYGGNGVIGYYDEYILSGDFILVGRVGALCGNVHYVEGDFWVTNNSIALKCIDSERVHPPYLARLLSYKELRGLASGTAQPHLTVTKIKNIEVKLPPVGVQIELERFLSELDKELRLHNELANKLISKGDSLKSGLHHHILQI